MEVLLRSRFRLSFGLAFGLYLGFGSGRFEPFRTRLFALVITIAIRNLIRLPLLVVFLGVPGAKYIFMKHIFGLNLQLYILYCKSQSCLNTKDPVGPDSQQIDRAGRACLATRSPILIFISTPEAAAHLGQ